MVLGFRQSTAGLHTALTVTHGIEDVVGHEVPVELRSYGVEHPCRTGMALQAGLVTKVDDFFSKVCRYDLLEGAIETSYAH